MKLNIAKTKKQDLIWMSKHKCKHHMDYIQHYNCFIAEHPDNQKVGYIDIECTNLKADFGIVLCYCIKDAASDKIYEKVITKKDLTTVLDKNVLKQCIEDMQRFDRLLGFYSSRFDIKFLRTRAVALGLEFPEFGSIIHEDVYFMVRNRFCLSSNRLENACRALLGRTEKTRLDSIYWIKALTGDEESLKYILDHCEHDVTDLQKLHEKISDFSMKRDNSL